MMPLAAPGDDHPAGLSNAPAELHGLLIGRVRGRQTGRAEHRHLAHGAIRREDLEGIAQLLQRGVEQLHIAARGAVAEELVGRLADLLDELLYTRRLTLFRVRVFVDLLEAAVCRAATGALLWVWHIIQQVRGE